MLAPQSGQTRLRIAEINPMLVLLTEAVEVIVVSPFCDGSLSQLHENSCEGSQAQFGRAPVGQRPRPHALDSNLRANVSPNASLGRAAKVEWKFECKGEACRWWALTTSEAGRPTIYRRGRHPNLESRD